MDKDILQLFSISDSDIELEEKYISFNNEYIGDSIHAEQALNSLIKEYSSSI